MTPRYRLSLLLALGLVVAACGGSAEPSPATVAETGDTVAAATTTTTTPGEGEPERSFAGVDPAPEFPTGLDWLNTGRALTIEELEGKIVLLDFWTYGCINCIHIIPDLERLEREFDEELVVIGVHSAKFEQEGETDNVRQVVLRYGLEHPVVNDPDFEVWNLWRARAWPTLVLIDPAGNVVGGHSGEGVYPLFQPVISSLVQEFDDQINRADLDFRLEREGLPATILSFPGKVHADVERDRLFIADTNHNRIVNARLSDGEVLAVYGSGRGGFSDGAAGEATFEQPQGLALSPDGQTLYVADTANHAVRSVALATGEVATVAGTGVQGQWPPSGGTAPGVALNSPWDLLLDEDLLYVAMAGSHQIWTIDLGTGGTGPFAGSAAEGTVNGPREDAELAQPSGLALDDGGNLYFADSESSAIRFVETGDGGNVELLVGSDRNLFDFGDVDGVGDMARLQHPLGVTVLGDRLFVADTYNSKIKAVDLTTAEITTFAGADAGWADGADPRFYEPGGIHAAGGKLYVADTNNHAVRVVDPATGDTETLILKGIERFAPTPDDEDFLGTLVNLEQVTVAPGVGSITLDVSLPPGYKVNEDAPSSMTWRSDVAELGADAERSITGTTFPVQVAATFTSGTGTVVGDVNLIWCANDAESLCFIAQLRFTVPVAVAAGGATDVAVPYELTLPDL